MDKKDLWRVIAKSIFYFAVLVTLLYLYSYSHSGGVHFIYNEF